jgi:hypothetical protein
MHNLEFLAERLVLTYEDEENLRDFSGFSERAERRAALTAALRQVLERAVTEGKIGGPRLSPNNEYAPTRFPRFA